MLPHNLLKQDMHVLWPLHASKMQNVVVCDTIQCIIHIKLVIVIDKSKVMHNVISSTPDIQCYL